MKPANFVFQFLFVLFVTLFEIKCQEAPKAAPITSIGKHKEGGSATFVCVAEKGDEPIKFQWFRNGLSLPISSTVQIQNLRDSSLLIINPISISHNGNYSCEIVNRFGKDISSIQVAIEGPPQWKNKPDKLYKFHIDEPIKVKCSAIGSPKPQKTFKKFSGSSWTVVQIQHSVDDEYDLITSKSSKNDENRYGCEISNGIEPNLWAEFDIQVLVFPAKFNEKKAFISSKRENLLELECSAEGDKPITVKWSKDSVALSKIDFPRYQIVDQPTENGVKSILTVRSADIVDDGSYQCLAENSFGKDERIIRVTIIEPPAAPQNFQVRQAWSRSVSITWTAPSSSHSPVLGYIVRYWKVSGPNGNERLREVNISSPINSYLINNLEPGSYYESEIIAVNEVGQGHSSRIIKFETSEEEPTGTPIDLQAVARGPTTIRVSWKAPPKDKWNGKLLGYYVGYRPIGDYKTPHSFKTVDVSSHNHSYEYLLTGLVKGTAYSVTVKAFNSAGSGPEYEEITAETLLGDVPPTPRFQIKLTTADSLTIKYTLIPSSSMSVQLIHIHFKEADEFDWRELAINYDSKDSGETTINNLNPNTVYKIYLTSSNEHGFSDPSVILQSRTSRSTRDAHLTGPGLDGRANASLGSFGEMVNVLSLTISIASIIIVIVIAFVFVRKAQLEASTKTSFEFCQAYGTDTLAFNQSSSGIPCGTVQKFVDHDKTMSLMHHHHQQQQASLMDEPLPNNTLPTPYSKIPIGSTNRGSTLMDSRHVYDYPQ